MTTILIQTILGAALTFLIYFLINPKKEAYSKLNSSDKLLKPNAFYLVCGIIFLFAPVGLFVAYLIRKEAEIVPFLIGFILFFIPLGLLLLKGFTTHRLHYNDEKMVVTNWFGKTKSLHWSQVESAKYNSVKGAFIINGNGKHLSIQPFMNGIPTFLNALVEKSGVDRKKLASSYVNF